MANLKLFSSLILVLILLGCSSAPTVITRVIKEPVEYAVHDTITLHDTIYHNEPVWEGNVEDSLKNVIGWLRVYYNSKIAELKLTKKDTVTITVRDTVRVKEGLLPVITNALTWWENILVYGVLSATIGFIIYLRSRKVKFI